MCYFCSRYIKDSHGNGSCFLRRRLYCLFFQDAVRLINPVDDVDDYIPRFEDCFKIFIVPGFNLLYFIKTIHVAFFYKLTINKAELKENGYLQNYELYIQRNSYFILQLFVGINMAFAIVLCIPFLLLNIYFIFFIIIISVPFKFYPLKYVLALGYD